MSMERSIGELVIQTKNRDEKAAEELIRLTEGRAYASTGREDPDSD